MPKVEESAPRGTKIRTETGVDREKSVKGVSNDQALKGRDMPDKGLSRSISGSKVPTP
jgi:hypothetical protein